MRTLRTDGKIRVLQWWDEHKLLLAGCIDEQVCAFDAARPAQVDLHIRNGPRSVRGRQDLLVQEPPGHEGIHGLYTGTFDDAKSRCFVGSACTLEILDETGGAGETHSGVLGATPAVLATPGKEGSQNLLVSQWPNGFDDLAIVNSRTMAVTGRGYYAVPAGHTFVGGWTAQNRTALVYEDLDGDGKQELATAINGTWNRVSVYSAQGQPLVNAQFGPGASSDPRAQMRDMDVADLNDDGKQEFVVATADGLDRRAGQPVPPDVVAAVCPVRRFPFGASSPLLPHDSADCGWL